LTSYGNARTALTALNAAITNVAAQDRYVGAQINTLNAVGQVLSTQKENVVAAQNAVQATDYATAASNMSKYQILSQTGISALGPGQQHVAVGDQAASVSVACSLLLNRRASAAADALHL
jgi:flagellin-like hook-associated protein FlgL